MPTLSEILGAIESTVTPAKRRIVDALMNPRDYAAQAFSNAGENLLGYQDAVKTYGQESLLGNSVMADPKAKSAALSRIVNGLLGVMPVGAIEAWHGSPHKFTKFDNKAIGTGEGAQAYGHGFYAAEARDVAQRYRDTLTNFRPDHIEAKLVERGISPEFANTYAQYSAQTKGGGRSFDEFAKMLNEKSPSPYIEQFRQRLRAELPKAKAEADAIGGNLYRLSLQHPNPAKEAATPLKPEDFLQWDRPLAEQPEAVRKALLRAPPFNTAGDYLYYKDQGYTGGDFIERLGELVGKGREAEVSAHLKQQGIPGIRYLDGGSRGAGQGTYNYVVFDPEYIKVLERNGLKVE